MTYRNGSTNPYARTLSKSQKSQPNGYNHVLQYYKSHKISDKKSSCCSQQQQQQQQRYQEYAFYVKHVWDLIRSVFASYWCTNKINDSAVYEKIQLRLNQIATLYRELITRAATNGERAIDRYAATSFVNLPDAPAVQTLRDNLRELRDERLRKLYRGPFAFVSAIFCNLRTDVTLPVVEKALQNLQSIQLESNVNLTIPLQNAGDVQEMLNLHVTDMIRTTIVLHASLGMIACNRDLQKLAALAIMFALRKLDIQNITTSGSSSQLAYEKIRQFFATMRQRLVTNSLQQQQQLVHRQKRRVDASLDTSQQQQANQLLLPDTGVVSTLGGVLSLGAIESVPEITDLTNIVFDTANTASRDDDVVQLIETNINNEESPVDNVIASLNRTWETIVQDGAKSSLSAQDVQQLRRFLAKDATTTTDPNDVTFATRQHLEKLKANVLENVGETTASVDPDQFLNGIDDDGGQDQDNGEEDNNDDDNGGGQDQDNGDDNEEDNNDDDNGGGQDQDNGDDNEEDNNDEDGGGQDQNGEEDNNDDDNGGQDQDNGGDNGQDQDNGGDDQNGEEDNIDEILQSYNSNQKPAKQRKQYRDAEKMFLKRVSFQTKEESKKENKKSTRDQKSKNQKPVPKSSATSAVLNKDKRSRVSVVPNHASPVAVPLFPLSGNTKSDASNARASSNHCGCGNKVKMATQRANHTSKLSKSQKAKRQK